MYPEITVCFAFVSPSSSLSFQRRQLIARNDQLRQWCGVVEAFCATSAPISHSLHEHREIAFSCKLWGYKQLQLHRRHLTDCNRHLEVRSYIYAFCRFIGFAKGCRSWKKAKNEQTDCSRKGKLTSFWQALNGGEQFVNVVLTSFSMMRSFWVITIADYAYHKPIYRL